MSCEIRRVRGNQASTASCFWAEHVKDLCDNKAIGQNAVLYQCCSVAANDRALFFLLYFSLSLFLFSTYHLFPLSFLSSSLLILSSLVPSLYLFSLLVLLIFPLLHFSSPPVWCGKAVVFRLPAWMTFKLQSAVQLRPPTSSPRDSLSPSVSLSVSLSVCLALCRYGGSDSFSWS